MERFKPAKNILFVTGTDTGVGKTVFTGMLLHHLRSLRCRARAMKPFCSGSHDDVDILRQLQDNELSADQINPYYFPDPVAPIASRGKKNQKITASTVANKIRAVARNCDVLLVEGCGGLKVPITDHLFLIDVIAELKCPVILVGANKLGVLNHVLLSVEALKTRGLRKITIALMGQGSVDASTKTNPKILSDLLKPLPVFSIEFLGKELDSADGIKRNSHTVRKLWAKAGLSMPRLSGGRSTVSE